MAQSAAWEERAGRKMAEAWRAMIGRARDPREDRMPDGAYHRLIYTWLDDALEEVLAGTLPAAALRYAQERAATFAACCARQGGRADAWRACALEADPALSLPEN